MPLIKIRAEIAAFFKLRSHEENGGENKSFQERERESNEKKRENGPFFFLYRK